MNAAMNRLQCHYCKRWLSATPENIEYYATAKHPVMCVRCVNEAETACKGHTIIVRTPEFIIVDRY